MNINDEILSIKNSPAVIAHVEMMQTIISRMAGNSAKCKEWCFALIGALIAYILGSDSNIAFEYSLLYWLAGLFCILDAFYLGLERTHKENLKLFLEKINDGESIATDIFFPRGAEIPQDFSQKITHQILNTFKGLTSLSIIIPYGLLFLIIFLFHPTNPDPVDQLTNDISYQLLQQLQSILQNYN